MSSDKSRKGSIGDNKGSSEGKPTPSGNDAGSKSADSHHVQSTGGHEETGFEKYSSSGGSGGVPIRNGQGYESLAHH